jgi:diadenylate cyclase
MPNILQILNNGLLHGWRPALEIAILSVGIYFSFKFVRGTRGAPVVYGFILLVLSLTVLAHFLRLEVLSWLIRSFATSHEQRENIEVIIQTVERLAEVRIGALIAIEQSINLQEATESGLPVNCEATPEMLEAIFFPNNAIHDGGVIIKGDRIAFAACIFPLTQRQDLNPSLGTRHRAAIGLSEETDAVVVVVSEETGSISHAYKGQLVRGVSAEQLRAFLTSVLVKPGKSHKILGLFRSAEALSAKESPAAVSQESKT